LLVAACTPTSTTPAEPAATEASSEAVATEAPAEEGEEAEATPEAAEEAAEETAEGAEAPAALRVGLVTDVGRVNDRSFNQSAWEGVQNYAEAAGLSEDDFRYVETQAATDYADNIQQF